VEKEINLLDYWRVIVKKKWIIIILAIAVGLGSFVFSSRQPKTYKATATIMSVDIGGGGLVAGLSSVPFLGGIQDTGAGKMIPVLESATLAKQVSQHIDLEKYFPKQAYLVKLNEEQRTRIVARALRGAISVNDKGSLIGVSIEWSNPEQAAELSNYYVQELGKFLNQRSLNVNFHVIDPAVPPTSHFKPKPKLSLTLGLAVGLFIGIGLAFVLEYFEGLNKAV